MRSRYGKGGQTKVIENQEGTHNTIYVCVSQDNELCGQVAKRQAVTNQTTPCMQQNVKGHKEKIKSYKTLKFLQNQTCKKWRCASL